MVKSIPFSSSIRKTQELCFGLCRLLFVQVCIAASEVTKNNGSFLETLYNRFFLLVKQLLTGNCAIYNGFLCVMCKVGKCIDHMIAF